MSEVKIRGIMECSVCLETFKNPKCLPCGHTFCLECLKCHGKDGIAGDEMLCPLCRREFRIPPVGLEQLPNNFVIEQMMEALNNKSSGSPDDGKVMCETCGKVEASKFCLECRQDLCESCELIHGRTRATEWHKIVTQDDKMSSALMTSARSSYCEKHRDKQLELYCNDCETAICLKCSALEHGPHVKSDLQRASEKFAQDIKQSTKTFDKFVPTTRLELSELEADKEEFLKQLLDIERAIKSKGETIKRLVDFQVAQLFQQLESIKNDRLKEIKTRKDEVERQLLTLESYHQYVNVLMDKGTHCDISRNAKELMARAATIVSSQETFHKNKLAFLRVTFSEPDIQSTTSGATQLVGTVSAEGNRDATLVIVGLDKGSSVEQLICHVSLSRGDTVNTISSTPTYLCDEAAACTFVDSLYVVGLGEARNELWKYSAESQWTRLADMESSRCEHCVAVVGSMLYVLGGWDGGTALSGVLRYNISSNTWSTVGQLINAVERAACIAYKDSIYVFGGNDHPQMYNTVSQKCKMMPSFMPRACTLLRAVLWKTSALIFGYQTCIVYNFETQTWLVRKQFKTDVKHFGLTLDNDTLYVAGGGQDTTSNVGRAIWTCSDLVRSVSVMDIISDKPAVWKHHAKLPLPACISSFSPSPLTLGWKH